ncbi:hypothetical protein GOM49_09710 [Clostridium bovifaecis]|uniref:Phage holin n=1 Tax=Clostridium bovifaecis TaxID=2184719 RepID=A0A6I6F4M4_9CLOT|nr:hypothetical protein GOM49_09710 [Clostridium bovifaecis]
MTEIVIQYVLVVLLILGLAYFVYLLKDKGISLKEDYYGITYTILNFLNNEEATPENVKKILRVVSKVVSYVEVSSRDEENDIKEEKALVLAKEAIDALGFENEVDDESLRNIIRLCTSIMPPTNKVANSDS